MSFYRLAARAALVAPLLLAAPVAQAGIGDLLVAPTRVVLNGGRGTEIILNNIGEDVATYRVSVELAADDPGRNAERCGGSERGRAAGPVDHHVCAAASDACSA